MLLAQLIEGYQWILIILLVALRMLLGLAWRPDEIFTIEYL